MRTGNQPTKGKEEGERAGGGGGCNYLVGDDGDERRAVGRDAGPPRHGDLLAWDQRGRNQETACDYGRGSEEFRSGSGPDQR